MTADERKELLTKLITGEIKAKRPFVIGGKIMEYPEEPTHRDRISAIAELNKMDGAYAPTKLFHRGELTQKLLNVDPIQHRRCRQQQHFVKLHHP